MARGMDDREVQIGRVRKSVGAETTFSRDLPDGDELRAQLSRLAEQVAAHLRKSKLKARTVTLKLRYSNFHTITRQRSQSIPLDDGADVAAVAANLLDGISRPADRFRLVGVHASGLLSAEGEQLTLQLE
jgi:DNA polymerase-4